uniref:hypothetical protein n=1 Tax=Myroides sp. N17-2 TaxID=2030799 RepID=UPI000EFCB5A6
EDNQNGTFTYFSEADYDKDGNKVGKGVDFNANTLSIVERNGKEQGIYDFFDGEHKDTPLMTISTRANSIYFDNSSTIIEGDNLQEVIENIINKIEVAQGTPSSIKGGEILINGEVELGEAVLKEMTLSIAPGAITTEKIEAGGKKQILITNAKGEVVWVDANEEVIKEIVKSNETVTVLEDKGNGTFTYFSEADYDKEGNKVGEGVKFNANTLSIVERKGKEQGIYDFFDGEHKDTPLMTISTRANSIYFDNSSTTIEGDNLQEVIENIINKIEVAQGTPSSIKGGEILINGEVELGEAVLKEMTLSIAPGAITTEKIEAGGKKQILITNAKGEVVWVDANEEVIKEIVKSNETVTVLEDKGNGTFFYYNEEAIDKDGNLIEANAVKFDSNTLRIVAQDNGKYAFFDGRSETVPVAVIDVTGTVIENITEILNNQEVKEQIFTTVAAQGKKVSGDTAIEITGGEKAALNAMTISLKNEGVTPEKIAAGSKKQILITNAEGKVQWVDANEEVIKEVVQKNERITRLEAKENGTFVYYNELAVNEKGEVIGEGVEFDANTLSILENTPGIFTFSDKKGKIKDLDIRASNIIVDDSTIGSGNDNVQDVLETIFEIIKNIDSQKRDLKGKGILVNGGSVVEKALLEEVELSIADNAITTAKLAANAVITEKVANHAITEDKLWAGKGRDKQVAVVQADGSVKFQEFNAVVTGKMLSVDNSLTVEGDASKALLNPLEIKVNELGIVTKHIDHKAVTAAKIGSEEATLNAVLAANGSGGSAFTPVSTVVSSAMQGDIEGDDAIKVTGGDNVIFGDDEKKAIITLNKRGVKGGHIATQTILNENIADTTIAATKLNGGTDNVNAVATVIDAKGTVAYQPLTSGAISDKAALKTDGIITIGGLNQQEGTLLKEATLSIAPKGINTTQIADNAVDNLQIADLAVSSDKITSGTVGTGRVLLSDVDGKTKWGELDDITTQLAGDLITDEIIQLTSQDGDGQKALLKDVKLSINENSITKSKLSSVEGGVNTAEDMLLVADGKGGFKYIKKEIMAIETEDLTLGSALTFTNGSNGIDAVLVNTSIDVNDLGISTAKLAEGAVTTGKISSVGANQNTVLTADGSGKVAYKKLTNSAFEGQEADLLSDGSLLIPANNKAVLTATTIGIAESGVQTQHIANRAVTADKIGAEGTTNGLVLVTKDGGAEFSSLSDAISGTGKDITEGSAITVTNGKQAALKEVTIDVKNLGITNAKIAERTIQASKFDAKGTVAGTVLTSMGDGEAKYAPLNQFAKPLGSDSSIEVSTNKGVLLADATIKVKELGIGTQHLGANAVTAEKMSSKVGAGVAEKQQLLMADGEGGVYFGISENVVTKGNITNGTTISATQGGVGAVFQDVTLEVNGLSINTGHIKDNAISPAKINKNAVTAEKIDTNAVIADKIANNAVTTDKINANAVTEAKLAKDAVTTDKIKDGAITNSKLGNDQVTNYKIANGAVTTNKMSAGNATIGHVLTVEKDGKVAFKETNLPKADLKGSSTIDVKDGTGAVLREVSLMVNNASIGQDHLTYDAVGPGELQVDAVETEHIADNAVTDEKISSDGVKGGYVLTADGDGGVVWEEQTGGNDSGNGNFEESGTIEIDGEEDGRGNGAFFKDLKFNVKGGSIGQDHLTYDAVGSGELQDDAVNNEHIADHAVTDSKISSDGIEGGYVLTADGEGGVVWEEQTGGNDSGNGELEESDTIGIESGYADGALFHDLQLKVKEGSIDTEHIAGDAIQNHHIEDLAVSEEKIFSDDADAGDVLIADGDGGARWGKPTGGSGNISSPKFFYLPAIYVEMVSGKGDSIEIYDYYADQFGSPMLSSTGDSTLPVYGKDELNYYVTYYDEDVFEDMQLDYDGELHYKVKDGATPTGRTFFNIVLEVK